MLFCLFFLRILDHNHIYCVGAFFTLFYLVTHLVVLTDAFRQTCGMNKDFTAAILWCYKSKTFLFIINFTLPSCILLKLLIGYKYKKSSII